MSEEQNVSTRPRTTKGSPQAQSKTHPPLDRLAYTMEEVAEMLSLCRTTVFGLARAGKIRRTKVGRRSIVLSAHLAAFLADLHEESTR